MNDCANFLDKGESFEVEHNLRSGWRQVKARHDALTSTPRAKAGPVAFGRGARAPRPTAGLLVYLGLGLMALAGLRERREAQR